MIIKDVQVQEVNTNTKQKAREIILIMDWIRYIRTYVNAICEIVIELESGTRIYKSFDTVEEMEEEINRILEEQS